jgi:hypothetical protein
VAYPPRQSGDGKWRRAISAAVIGQSLSNHYASGGVPHLGAHEEARVGRASLVGEHFGGSAPGAQVDGNLDALLGDSPQAALSIATDAMAYPVRLLDVEGHEVPRPLACIAQDRARWLRTRQAIESQAPKFGDHRRNLSRILGEPATAPAMIATLKDLAPPKVGHVLGREMGPFASRVSQKNS